MRPDRPGAAHWSVRCRHWTVGALTRRHPPVKFPMTRVPDYQLDSPSSLTADAVLDVWRRRKWIGIIVFAAVFAAAAVAVMSLPNLYRASATVLVERPRISEAFVRQSVTAELETRIQTIH